MIKGVLGDTKEEKIIVHTIIVPTYNCLIIHSTKQVIAFLTFSFPSLDYSLWLPFIVLIYN